MAIGENNVNVLMKKNLNWEFMDNKYSYISSDNPVSFWTWFWLLCIKKILIYTRNVVYHFNNFMKEDICCWVVIIFKAMWTTIFLLSEILDKYPNIYTKMTWKPWFQGMHKMRLTWKHELTYGIPQYAKYDE